MKRVLVRGAIVGVSVCAFAMSFAGCYWLASYKDLTSGSGDAGTEASLGSGGDDDASSVVDAGSITEGDAGPPGPFCPPDAGPYAYCMDFDGVDASALGLGTTLANASIVTGTSVSPPSSLAVTLNGNASEGAYGVSFDFQPTVARLEFQVLTIQSGQWVTLLNISLIQDAAHSAEGLNVVATPDGQFQVQEYIQLGDGGVEQGGPPAAVLDGGTFGTWHHVVLMLTVDDAAKHYSSNLSVDDQLLVDDAPLEFPWVPGTASLGIGVTYGGGSGPQFFFDNVRADFTVPTSGGTELRPDTHDPRAR